MLKQRLYEVDFAAARHHKEVESELRAAVEKFPQWPDDIFAALAIVGEEFGELTKDVLQFYYEKHKGKTEDTIRAEAVQTIAMLHRFLNSLDTNRYVSSSTAQHTL